MRLVHWPCFTIESPPHHAPAEMERPVVAATEAAAAQGKLGYRERSRHLAATGCVAASCPSPTDIAAPFPAKGEARTARSCLNSLMLYYAAIMRSGTRTTSRHHSSLQQLRTCSPDVSLRASTTNCAPTRKTSTSGKRSSMNKA
jgi:hypothetical protein